MYVLGVPVLVGLGRVAPAGVTEHFVNAVKVVHPDRDVDVGMRSRQPASVKVDRPAAEYPVVDPLPLEQLMESSESCELSLIVVVCAHRRTQYGDPTPTFPAYRSRSRNALVRSSHLI